MDLDLRILPECYIDTTLAEALAFPKRGYKHIKGCNNVLAEMNKRLKNEAALGIIDDDKCVPAQFNSFALLKRHNENLAIYKHHENPHYIVKISKAAEDFILKNAEKSGISLSDYNLPDNLPNLMKQTKSIAVKNNPELKRLFSAIKQNENSDFYVLARWIELFKENPYNMDSGLL
ncbi:MAG: hypothetical protein LBR10_10125 [Prevotellaceae bacterium]|jgi:hypothetical protein|nr:hypothetical protein [Prevotellaceae bacterium]